VAVEETDEVVEVASEAEEAVDEEVAAGAVVPEKHTLNLIGILVYSLARAKMKLYAHETWLPVLLYMERRRSK